eukprot:3711320-Karenia_brevis.AAC.1
MACSPTPLKDFVTDSAQPLKTIAVLMREFTSSAHNPTDCCPMDSQIDYHILPYFLSCHLVLLNVLITCLFTLFTHCLHLNMTTCEVARCTSRLEKLAVITHFDHRRQ